MDGSSTDSQKSGKIGKWLTLRYYNPRLPGSYSGARALHARVKPTSYSGVTNWLRSQDAYTLHKTPRRRFLRRKTIVSGINEQWQCDLIDLSSLKAHNSGMTFVLTAIDVFSKVGCAIPLKNKTSANIIKALTSAFEKSPSGPPRTLQTDKGTEFTNRNVQAFLKEQGVKHFVSENDDIKCAIVERWNRTMKERLWRYFTKHNTHHYLKVLPDLVNAYNSSHHRSIGMAPVEVNVDNQEEVWQRLYGDPCCRASTQMSGRRRRRKKEGKKTLKVGATVRISKSRRQFKKGYLPSWTTETFTVTQVLKTTPVTYRLVDENEESIAGSFYAEELQAITQPPNKLHKIEKVLKRRGNRVLVRWEGYPPSFDSWIGRRDIERV